MADIWANECSMRFKRRIKKHGFSRMHRFNRIAQCLHDKVVTALIDMISSIYTSHLEQHDAVIVLPKTKLE